MRILKLSILAFLFSAFNASAQEIKISETGTLNQVYEESVESENLLSFNDLDLEFGYVLYQAEIDIETDDAILDIENVRDYGVVYIDGKLQGIVTDNNKKMTLTLAPGKYQLSIYVENIGRITYGPEILDNNKGLFGSINLDGNEIEEWTMTPLNIKNCDINQLEFGNDETNSLPSFHRGSFDIDTPNNCYLDIRGWGMGEVWINGNYIGSYWENEKQQSIQISAENLLAGKNTITIFEMKNNNQKAMNISDNPIFK